MLILISLIGIILSPQIIGLISKGFLEDTNKFQLTVKLLQILFPYIFLISISTLISGILNSKNIFSIQAINPAILNISIIISIIYLKDYFNPTISVLAWAILIGGILQIIFQIPYIYKLGYLHLPKFKFTKEIKQIFKKMIPIIFSASIVQISILISTYFQSFLGDGGVSWIYYADRLMEFPTSLLNVSLMVILLPNLSKYYSDENKSKFYESINWGIKLSIYLTIPASIGLVVLSYPIIATLFMYGKFSQLDATYTQIALIGYAIGLLPLGLVKILSSAFYSHQNVKTPVKIAIISLVFTILTNYIFFKLKVGILGISLSITLGSYLNMILLFFQLHKYKIYTFNMKINIIFILKVILSSSVMGLLIYLINNQYYIKFIWNYYVINRILQLTFLIIIGVFTYFLTSFLIKLKLPKNNTL